MLGKDPSEAFDTFTHTHTFYMCIFFDFVSPVPNNNKAASYSLLGCLVYARQYSKTVKKHLNQSQKTSVLKEYKKGKIEATGRYLQKRAM